MPTTPLGLPTDTRVREYRLSEILSALAYALDLADGQPPGHTLRTTAIGMRFADELEFDDDARSTLFYSLLLAAAGGSADSAIVASAFGSDDLITKRDLHSSEAAGILPAFACAWRTASGGVRTIARLQALGRIAAGGHAAKACAMARAAAAAEISQRLGLPDEVADAVRCVDERWDGRGHPGGLRGESIPLGARIASVAGTLERHLTARGSHVALERVRLQRGGAFDPALADRCQLWRPDHAWWSELLDDDLVARVQALEPGGRSRVLDDAGLDRVARAFAGVVDAKSPFTVRHSGNVAMFARGIGELMGLDPHELRVLERAALLHDLGKLAVSNRILDSAAPLAADERQVMSQHPRFTWSVLRRSPVFRDFAWTAALHHERLDGSGYPWGLGGDDLDLDARILAVADVYEALVARRPYREGLPTEQAIRIIRKDTPFRYDGHVLAALETWLGV